MIKEIRSEYKKNWNDFKVHWERIFNFLNLGDIFEAKKITDIDVAMSIFEQTLATDNYFGADFFNSWTFGNITKIWKEEDIIFIKPNDSKVNISFKFKSLVIAPLESLERDYISPIIFLESDDWELCEEEKSHITSDWKRQPEKFYANLYFYKDSLVPQDRLDLLFFDLKEGEKNWSDVKESFKVVSAGIIGFLNIQRLEYEAAQLFLYKLSLNFPKISGEDLIEIYNG